MSQKVQPYLFKLLYNSHSCISFAAFSKYNEKKKQNEEIFTEGSVNI